MVIIGLRVQKLQFPLMLFRLWLAKPAIREIAYHKLQYYLSFARLDFIDLP